MLKAIQSFRVISKNFVVWRTLDDTLDGNPKFDWQSDTEQNSPGRTFNEQGQASETIRVGPGAL
jgi:hypothetical protein